MIRKTKYTKKMLEPIVAKSFSMAEVLRNLGLKMSGGTYKFIFQHIKHNNISMKHFTGQSWSKGKTKDNDPRIRKMAQKISIPNEEIFVKNARPISGGRLAERLLKLGWEYKCSECNLVRWRDKPITLHVDHINGIGNDNRYKNLRFLCPNCHQQTPTWGNKGSKQVVVKKKCINCNTQINIRSTRCKSCAQKLKVKINWPPIIKLIKMVEESNYSAVGRLLGVSDNAVRKRIKNNQQD